jgi:hypothetical protein
MKQIKKFKKTKPLPLAPTTAPPPWGDTLDAVQKHLMNPLTIVNPGDRIVLQVVDVTLVAALHWVYKKRWKSKYRIPQPAKAFETWGDLFCSYLSLCTELHSLHPLGRNYLNAGEWFLAICREFRADGFAQGTQKHTKSGDLAVIRGSIQHLQIDPEIQNPLDQKEQPHLWALLQSALELRQRSDTIENLMYGTQGLVPVLKKLASEIDRKGTAAFWSEEGGLMIQDKNRGLIQCGNPLITTFLSGAKIFN